MESHESVCTIYRPQGPERVCNRDLRMACPAPLYLYLAIVCLQPSGFEHMTRGRDRTRFRNVAPTAEAKRVQASKVSSLLSWLSFGMGHHPRRDRPRWPHGGIGTFEHLVVAFSETLRQGTKCNLKSRGQQDSVGQQVAYASFVASCQKHGNSDAWAELDYGRLGSRMGREDEPQSSRTESQPNELLPAPTSQNAHPYCKFPAYT